MSNLEMSKPVFKWKTIIIAVFVLNILFFCFQVFEKKRATAATEKLHLSSIKMQSNIDSVIPKDERNTIVLRLLKHDCKECIDSLFNNTIRLAKTLGKEKVAVLMSNGYQPDEFLTYKRIYQYDLNVYRLTTRITPYDQLTDSYYFYRTSENPDLAQHPFLVKGLEDSGYSTAYKNWFGTVFKNFGN